MDKTEALGEIIKSAPKLSSTAAQLLLLDRYETTYGVFNHEDPAGGSHPFAPILMHWNQDVITSGALHERMTRYIDVDIAKYFNLSWVEFIEQPTYICDMQIRIATEKIRKDAPGIEKALQAFADDKTK